MFMRFLKMVVAITIDIFYDILYFIQVNMRYVATIADIALPYCMYILGQNLAVVRGCIKVGGEVVIPILCTVVIHYTREIANKSGKGDAVPIPNTRFTEVDNDGEVSVDNSRLQELILYMADLEDYMERKRWL